ncbi:NAD-dependent epimerase/dehydratase family protein [Candidatus Micrarchaeota archaeon]|nr:NAD-dependent epimerase/dehydratase family protein [Candidatus Micrarchaeota archaeon]
MRILVTGALGFIGSNITERLIKDGHEVHAIDNLHTGDESNLAKILDKVHLFKGNSGDLGKMNQKFDAIIHEGVYSSSPMYKSDSSLFWKAISDWVSILDYSRKNDSKVVFASSSSLYNGNRPPHKEDMQIKVNDFYAEARYSMERLATLYTDFYGLRVVGLRYFSIYGPHEKSKGKYANLISQFLWDLLAGRSPLIFGDGSQSRDFTYVDDVVEANLCALNYNGSGIFNVGTGKSASLKDVVDMLNSQLGTKLEPIYETNKIKNYVDHTLADTSLAKKKLGFAAKVDLQSGIEKLISYYS